MFLPWIKAINLIRSKWAATHHQRGEFVQGFFQRLDFSWMSREGNSIYRTPYPRDFQDFRGKIPPNFQTPIESVNFTLYFHVKKR